MIRCFRFFLCASVLMFAVSYAIAETNMVPVVTWLRPTNGASFSAGSTFLLSARAMDSDGTVNYVDFIANSTSGTIIVGRAAGVSTNSIYNFPWSNAPAGIFQLHAEATDNSGAVGISASVQIVVREGGGTSNAPPTIVSQPQSQTVPAGSDATFSVTAMGTPPLSYSWRKNGATIPEVTSSTLTLPNVSSSDQGTYSVVVSNAFGSRTSSDATLTVTGSGTNNTAPVVAWLSPSNGASFTTGSTILLSARASDSDGTVRYVDFFANSNNVGRVFGPSTNSIYSFRWSNAPSGSFHLHAEAVDTAGARGISDSVQIVVGSGGGESNAPPTIVSQPQSQTVPAGSDVTFSVTATGTPPLGYRWRKNGAAIPGATDSSLTLFNVSSSDEGNYSVVVTNAFGSRSSSNATLTVTGSGTNNIAPAVTWLSPSNGASFAAGSVIRLSARATDSDGTVSFVDFFANSNRLGRVDGAPTNSVYSFIWSNAPSGHFRLHADALDNAGARGVSDSVEISVGSPPPTNRIPVVTWLAPSNHATFPTGSTIQLAARATDFDGTVSYVDFFANSNRLGRVDGSPTNGVYRFAWSNAPAGMFRLHAEAVDNAGARGISSSVEILVGPGGGGTRLVDLSTVRVSTIGHSFSGASPLPGMTMPRSVVDFLIDQDQSSGGGGLLPSVAVNWDIYNQFAITVSAPPGQKFLVHVPDGRAVGFGGYLWWESTRGGFSPSGPVTVRFTGLEGTAPDFSQSDATLSDSHGYFGFVDLETTTVSRDFAFMAITLIGTVTPQYTGNGTENYTPHHESSMSLHYTTDATDDPGRFVSIVPTTQPRIRLLSKSPDGAQLFVQGQAGRTYVVECSQDMGQWTAISTNTMPATLCPICPYVNLTDRTATDNGCRFYRVFEVPSQ